MTTHFEIEAKELLVGGAPLETHDLIQRLWELAESEVKDSWTCANRRCDEEPHYCFKHSQQAGCVDCDKQAIYCHDCAKKR